MLQAVGVDPSAVVTNGIASKAVTGERMAHDRLSGGNGFLQARQVLYVCYLAGDIHDVVVVSILPGFIYSQGGKGCRASHMFGLGAKSTRSAMAGS